MPVIIGFLSAHPAGKWINPFTAQLWHKWEPWDGTMETEESCPALGTHHSSQGQHCCPWRLCTEQRFGDLKTNGTMPNSYTHSLPIPDKTTAGAGAPPVTAGGGRGDPQSWFCSQAPVISWVELAFEGLFQWLSHSRGDLTHYWVKTLNKHRWECHSMQMHCWWGWAVFWWLYVRKKYLLTLPRCLNGILPVKSLPLSLIQIKPKHRSKLSLWGQFCAKWPKNHFTASVS